MSCSRPGPVAESLQSGAYSLLLRGIRWTVNCTCQGWCALRFRALRPSERPCWRLLPPKADQTHSVIRLVLGSSSSLGLDAIWRPEGSTAPGNAPEIEMASEPSGAPVRLFPVQAD